MVHIAYEMCFTMFKFKRISCMNVIQLTLLNITKNYIYIFSLFLSLIWHSNAFNQKLISPFIQLNTERPYVVFLNVVSLYKLNSFWAQGI